MVYRLVLSFEVVLRINEDANVGDFLNQVILSGIRLDDLEFDSVLSDDPSTAIPNDATIFSIEALSSEIDNQFFGICEGGETTIHAGVYGANSYLWSTGETTEEIIVDREGSYQVTITTDCDQTVATALVSLDEISLELGDDISLELGETITIEPQFVSQSPIRAFKWASDNMQALDCPTCKNLRIQGISDTQLSLTLENATGCSVSDQLGLKLVDIQIYAPNVFNPNSGGANNSFFLQGNLSFDIARFEIYDRWGNLMFQKSNIQANQANEGWDGTRNTQASVEGVYIWSAILRFKDGTQGVRTGNVTLVR